VVACLTCPAVCQAQAQDGAALLNPVQLQPVPGRDRGDAGPLGADGRDAPTRPVFDAPPADGFWAPFTALPGDLARFASMDTFKLVGVAAAGAAVVGGWDGEGMVEAQERLRPTGLFTAGNIGGGFLVQTGASLSVYAIGRLAHSSEVSALGSDLIRAQMLSQSIVQAGKYLSRRPRPDRSNNQSLPSGHTASAFATATVLQQHFGWKVGLPAYGFGAYVAASRMSANKHHLSDVLLGAAIGVAAGRSVTIGSGRARFSMGVAPTLGGAAVTFTRTAPH
jgi:membrane-associated phospholipid phosphatase